MDVSIRELVELEWRLLEEGPHTGQRAAEPEDWEQFAISRSSQLAAWTPALRESWRQDLLSAQAEGRSPIDEKHVYMLARTEPARYEALKEVLPEPSVEKMWLVDWICQTQVAWQESLAEKYPGLAAEALPARGSDGGGRSDAYENLLRGELMVCSVKTLRLYASHVERTEKAGGNLCEAILENAVRLLGYDSPEAAEKNALAKQLRAVPV